MNTGTYAFKALIYIDMLICAIFINRSGITISSTAGLALRHGRPFWAVAVSAICNFIGRTKTHCEDAIAGDLSRSIIAQDILTEKAPL